MTARRLRSAAARATHLLRPVSRSVILLMAVTCFTLLTGGSALASHVSCGQTITKNTKLDSDLVNCPGNGIVIGADKITLDLNGHTIDGDGALVDPCPDGESCDIGVESAFHDGVTIEGGSIREFAAGVSVFGTRENRLSRLAVSNSFFPGVIVGESTRSQIDRTTISANGLTTDQAGLVVFDSHDTRIERNTVADNGDIGMFVVGSDGNRVERNSASGNPEAGMVFEGNDNAISRNDVAGNGDGIIVAGDRNMITSNDVADALGCADGCGFGISFEGGTGNVIERNTVAHAHQAGIRLAAFDGPPSVGNVVRRNLILDAGVDGLLVESTATDTLIERNTAMRAGDDGIDIDNPAATLTRNLALNNGDLGIEALPGVTDGGGNKARGNGNPAQCTNVACT